VDPAPLIGHIADAYSNSGISTLVIGLPGTEQVFVVDGGTDARGWLSEAATAGGTADFDLTVASDLGTALGAALQAIVNRIAPCSYRITPPSGVVFDPAWLNVVYTDGNSNRYGVLQNQITGDCEVGWRFPDSTGQVIELCPETCACIGQDPFAQLSIAPECDPITRPI
jgi:hypothetical protein